MPQALGSPNHIAGHAAYVDNAALTNLIELQPERILQHRHFVKLIQAGVEHGFLPAGGTPGSLGGLNKKLMPRVPKRAWVRGKQSNSIPRTTQHAFMYWFVDNYGSRMRHKSRCLDWDGWYGGSVFASVCREVDVVEYGQPFGRVPSKALHWTSDPPRKADRWYRVDVHSMADHLEHGVYDLVIANSVFEHFRQPFRAMQQIVLLMRSGGYLFWHTPFQFEEHGVPDDYFRYTVAGAQAVAQAAGLKVESVEADGGYTAVLSNVLGLGAKFWTLEKLLRMNASAQAQGLPRHYLSTRMIAVKP